MVDITHSGMVVALTASESFPAPVPITYFADDTDPMSVDELTIADGAMGTNGHAIYWSTPNLSSFTIAVIAESPSHEALAYIFSRNVIKSGQVPAGDKITFSRVLPNGTTLALKNCRMTAGTPFMAAASSGRIATPTYTFMAPPSLEVIIPQL